MNIEFNVQMTNGDKITVLPRLVRMRTIKLMSFSGFVLTDRAYYSAAIESFSIEGNILVDYLTFLLAHFESKWAKNVTNK